MTPLPLPGPTPIPVDGPAPNPLPGTDPAHPSHDQPFKWTTGPDNRQRTLVLCFDGTGESFDVDNSNITKFLEMLRKDDPTEQVVYYQAGIGTYTSSVVKTPVLESISKLLDLMFASEVGNHIKEGYQFLMQNYRTHDQICIFGFSRGAITARALAGMLQKVGLLPAWNLEQLPFAYAMYVREDHAGHALSAQFKRTFCAEVEIKFLGIWDTVHSVGLIERHMPFSGMNNAIVYTRHALSLDERRVKFRPFFCNCGVNEKGGGDTRASGHNRDNSENTLHTIRAEVCDYETQVNSRNRSQTNVKEVFFAGAHSDVGGGSVKNTERHSLARITLRWMIRECFETGTGIIFDARMLQHEVGLDFPDTRTLQHEAGLDIVKGRIGPTLKPPKRLSPGILHLRKPSGAELEGFSFRRIPVAVVSGLVFPIRWVGGKLSNLRIRSSKEYKHIPEPPDPVSLGESREELVDTLSPIVDQIGMHPGWNIIEWLPWLVKRQEAEEANNFWAYKWIWNRGKGREVYEEVMKRGVKVHGSVRARMMASPMDGSDDLYLPKIRFPIDGELRCLTREEWLEGKYFEWVD